MRLERLYDLARIVRVDHLLGDNQEVMLKKLCLRNRFHSKNVDVVVVDPLLVDNNTDIDDFVSEMAKHL
jgi:hypothetical protein